MVTKEIFKVNYDDFYKFTISASIIVFIVCIIASSFIIINSPKQISQIKILFNFIASIYIILGAISLVCIYWAVKKWKQKQGKEDKILELDLRLKELEIDLKHVDLMERKKESYKIFEEQIKKQKRRIEEVSGALILDDKIFDKAFGKK